MKGDVTGKYLYLISEQVNLDLFGVKGENLSVLEANGFPVPLTLCLTVEAYNDHLKANQITDKIREILCSPDFTTSEKSARIKRFIMSGDVPDRIHTDLLENSYLKKADSEWAIRSSSNMEDLPGLSFAGLHESYLNVKGLDQILEMVKHCWASLWNERAVLYREQNNLDHTKASMAVIIQQMVNPRYSGVLFTRSPIHDCSDEALVEYSDGLGEELVSGKIAPRSCRMGRNTRSIQYLNNTLKGNLPDEELTRLFTLALSIEDRFGSPQDIEWAYDIAGFHILQTRPITEPRGPRETGLDKLWTRANIGEVLPGVVTPLTWSVFATMLVGRPLSSPETDLPKEMGIRLMKGRTYIRVDQFLNSFCYLPFVTPEILEKVLGLRITNNSSSYTCRRNLPIRFAQGMFLLNVAGIIPYLGMRVKSIPPTREKDHRGLDTLLRWNARCFKVHLLCTAYAIGVFAIISSCLNRWLSPAQAAKTLPLILIGHEDLQTAAQGRTLADLALFVQEHPALLELLEEFTEWTEVSRRLETVEGGHEFHSILEAFLQVNGARTAEELELALPRWRENPTFLLSVLRKLIEARRANVPIINRQSRQCQQEEAVWATLSILSPLKGFVFNRLLHAYKDFSTLRENMKYRLMEGYSQLRAAFLETGRMLRDKKLLAAEDDIFLLTPGEVDACLRDGGTADAAEELIRKRKQALSRFRDQEAADLVIDDQKSVREFENRVPSGDALTGVGCSPGIAEGPARILHDIAEAEFLRAGEILITPHTDPGWTPLFLTCKAIVTEIGGFLSHGATVAREYGVPAVVNVTGATRRILTGDLVRVDGTSGVVTIITSISGSARRNM